MTTSTETKKPTKDELRKKLAELEASLEKAKQARDDEMSKDWLAYAQDVTDKFFGGYGKVEAFLNRCVRQVEERGWVISPIGRRRTMYRVLTGSPKFRGDAGRRAKNSPIQGFSSEVGVTTGYLILQHIDNYLRTFDLPDEWFSLYCRAVHDASYFEEVVDMLIPSLHINQWVATQGVTDYYEEVFNFKFILSPEIEIGWGADAKKTYAWNWDLTSATREDLGASAKGPATLPEIFKQVLIDLAKAGHFPESKIPKLYRRIFEPWINKEQRRWLQSNYPLLLVPKLEKQICQCVRNAGFEPEV